MANKKALLLPEVSLSDQGPVRHLHLDSIWIQGSMRVAAPYELVHEYIQRMMAWLLFTDPDTVPSLQSLQLGLGAGSLTKFCARVLRMHNSTAIEINPQVLGACRGWFKLPEDSAQLQVVLGDASEQIRLPRWQQAVDALQVDLYDEEAAGPVFDSSAFYADCRQTLRPGGCMTVNLFGRSSSFQTSVQHLGAAFGMDAIWAFKATREGNTVLLAQRTPSRPARALLQERAEIIKARWGLPADKWVRVFKPVLA